MPPYRNVRYVYSLNRQLFCASQASSVCEYCVFAGCVVAESTTVLLRVGLVRPSVRSSFLINHYTVSSSGTQSTARPRPSPSACILFIRRRRDVFVDVTRRKLVYCFANRSIQQSSHQAERLSSLSTSYTIQLGSTPCSCSLGGISWRRVAIKHRNLSIFAMN